MNTIIEQFGAYLDLVPIVDLIESTTVGAPAQGAPAQGAPVATADVQDHPIRSAAVDHVWRLAALLRIPEGAEAGRNELFVGGVSDGGHGAAGAFTAVEGRWIRLRLGARAGARAPYLL